jgi:hypothetical protein
MKNDLSEDWNLLRSWLPDTAEIIRLARAHGFLKRVKGVGDVEVWLRLLLMHSGGGLSLEQTVLRARELRLANISSVALHNRLAKAGPWLEALTELMIGRCGCTRGEPKADPLLERLFAIDATNLRAPASTGTDWRVHYCVKLSNLRCEHLELTDKHGGEHLARFALKPGCIALADRGYCHRAGVAHMLEAGAQVVVRYNPKSFPLLNKNGQPLDVLGWLRTLPKQRSGECQVYFEHEGKKRQLRLCAVRMSEAAAKRALRRVKRKGQKAGHQPQEQTKQMSGYVMVLTSLERKEHSAARVLNIYRQRWQVELVFKRLKSLLELGEVPKQKKESARAWMQGKIITAMLVERAMKEARFFSPWGYELPESESVEAI